MKKTTFILAFLLVTSTQAWARINRTEYLTIPQPLDHFQAGSETLQQRVEILVPPGTSSDSPVLFFLGGEQPMVDIGKLAAPFAEFEKTHPLVFISAEHRGYGLSLSNDADQTVPAYVTADQAVADDHAVIQSLHQRFTGPWIAVGYSYAGGLAIRLASQFPQDVQAVYSSSGVLTWPFEFSGHDDAIARWPGNLHDEFAAQIKNLEPAGLFDDSWQSREFLQWFLVAIAQYKAYQGLIPQYLPGLAQAPTAQMIQSVHQLDNSLAQGQVMEWEEGRAKKNLSLSEAQTQKFYSRYWGFQQCNELGTFFTSSAARKIFPQNASDWGDYCFAMYGIHPNERRVWDWSAQAQNLSVPLFYIAGKNDPWFSLGLQPGALTSSNGKFYLIDDGFHAPDRDDPTIAVTVLGDIFKVLGL